MNGSKSPAEPALHLAKGGLSATAGLVCAQTVLPDQLEQSWLSAAFRRVVDLLYSLAGQDE